MYKFGFGFLVVGGCVSMESFFVELTTDTELALFTVMDYDGI